VDKPLGHQCGDPAVSPHRRNLWKEVCCSDIQKEASSVLLSRYEVQIPWNDAMSIARGILSVI